MHILYLGLTPPPNAPQVTHYPVIAIEPIPPQTNFEALSAATHLLFTSKTAVYLLKEHRPTSTLLPVIAVGQATAKAAEGCGYRVQAIAQMETAEGVVSLLDSMDLTHANLFWPRSAKARSTIAHYLKQRAIPFAEEILYTVVLIQPEPIPNLSDFDEVVFTSPSTVDGFLHLFPKIPTHLKLTCIGPVTQAHLDVVLLRPKGADWYSSEGLTEG